MRTASLLARVRAFASHNQPAVKPRRGRTAIAFFCALGAVVTGTLTFATDIKSVLAFEEGGAAAYFRADRALQQRSRPAAAAPAPAAPSIFGGRTLNIIVPASNNGNPNATLAKTPKNAADQPRLAKASKPKETEPENPIGEFASSSGARSVCVRLCDGYHFPVGDAPGSNGIAAHEAVCSATCPGAPTRLYVVPAGTDDISKAYSAREGRSYSALPVALRHADKTDKTCSCRRNNESQMSLVSLYRDFTLRSGDAIMTGEGFRVFRGSSQWPYKPRDFATLNGSKLGASERRLLNALERASIKANNSPRERPLMTPRTTASPVPSLGPFLVKKPAVAAVDSPARTAQAPGAHLQ